MSNLQSHYNEFLSLLHQLEPNDYFLNQRKKPKLSDKELIALSLASEAVSIDSELNLFNQLPLEVEGRIERSVYNRRRRNLSSFISQLQQRIANHVVPCETYHLIDSMPLEVCKYSRSKRSRVCGHFYETAPDYGYCASHNFYYFGYKIHAVCTEQGVFKSFAISKASLHDVHYLESVKNEFKDCVLIGDKGYLSRAWQLDLFEQSNIRLTTPHRNNQKQKKNFPFVFKKARKRIETLFSQLCDQFMIRRNYAKSFSGFTTRITAKMTALTLIQLSNKLAGRNLNNLKSVI